jgi:hypothetical protein
MDTIDSGICIKFINELNERKYELMSSMRNEDHDTKRFEYHKDEKAQLFYRQKDDESGSTEFLQSKIVQKWTSSHYTLARIPCRKLHNLCMGNKDNKA